MRTLIALLLATTMLAADEALAADIRIVSRIPGAGCHLHLRGPIQSGDQKRLAALLTELDREFSRRLENASMAELWSSRNPMLCLDSPGGSYPEGLRIAEHLVTPQGGHLRTGVSTSVEAGKQCLSACALIFMAGQFLDRGGERMPARILDVSGTLGFHAPYLDAGALPDKAYTRQELAAAHAAAVKSLQSAIRLFSFNIVEQSGGGGMRARPWVRPSLFAELLAARSNDEIFLIDTVGKAGRWDIDLAGVRSASALDAAKLKTACANFLAWQDDGEPAEDSSYIDLLLKDDPEYPTGIFAADALVFRFTYARATTLCVVTMEPEYDPRRPRTIRALRITLVQGSQRYDHPLDFPIWATESSGLPIAKLAAQK